MSAANDAAPGAAGAAAASSSPVAPAVRGAFIVLEGLDRSGKTTQVKLLESRLVEAGRRVQLMRFPGESAWDRPANRTDGFTIQRRAVTTGDSWG